MARKSSIYIKTWVERLLEGEGLSLNNDVIDNLIRYKYLPVAWGLDQSFEAYYDSKDYDIRRLLIAVGNVVTMPDYYNGPHLDAEEQIKILNFISSFLVRSDWDMTYDPYRTGDYDPKDYIRWLDGIAQFYDVAVREITWYLQMRDQLEKVGMVYPSRNGFKISDNDVKMLSMYEHKAEEWREQIKKHLPPASYLRMIITEWDFLSRFDQKPQAEIEFLILCSHKPLYSEKMVRDLRQYLNRVSRKYTEEVNI